jgi:hypothetical protein
VLGWVLQYMCLLLFLIYFVSLNPFLHIFVAIGSVIALYYFVVDLLVFGFGLCFVLKI